MNFAEAMSWLLDGYPVTRENWADEECVTWVGVDFDDDGEPTEVYMCSEEEGYEVDFAEYVADEEDMFAEDWFLACDMEEEDEDPDFDPELYRPICCICGR